MAKTKSGQPPEQSGSPIDGNGEPENITSGNDNAFGGVPVIDPTTATGSSAGTGSEPIAGTAKRGRGRPAGSGSKTVKAKPANISIKGIEQLLYTIHLGLAKVTGVEELEIDKDPEAKMLAEAMIEVAGHYNIGMLDPKTIAWMGLFGVIGTVYGPRMAAYKMRKEIERAKAPDKRGPVSQSKEVKAATEIDPTQFTSVPQYHQ